jgi:hypothetical protein
LNRLLGEPIAASFGSEGTEKGRRPALATAKAKPDPARFPFQKPGKPIKKR